tara:strand:+ start:456 stop:938 length:483 start_codon:yes stop_codon:yes gene_type:complete
MKNNDNLKILNSPISFLASCFGVGMSPIAPGTMGSLFAILFFYLTLDLGKELQTIIFFCLIISGFWICGRSAKVLNSHDHSSIVWDEMSVMYGILLVIDISFYNWLMAFLLFRLFDIWKPWPINFIDKEVKGGLGIMLDDIFAGFATILSLKFLDIVFLI